MLLTTALLTLTLAQAKPEPLELGAMRDALLWLADGRGHYVALDPENPYGEHLFYGDGKTLVRLRAFGGGKDGAQSWGVSLWDPRVRGGSTSYANLSMAESGKRYAIECGKKKAALTPVAPDEARKLAAAARFLPPSWTRQPARLLRDDEGTYFFVDHLRLEGDVEDRRDFRIFVGPRGNMKQLPLRDVVDDAKGMIFATRDGALRLVAASAPDRDGLVGKWVKGKTETRLTEVPMDSGDTVRLIYMDLGPYTGQRLGTPCDDLM
jgi:hypothetical protein